MGLPAACVDLTGEDEDGPAGPVDEPQSSRQKRKNELKQMYKKKARTDFLRSFRVITRLHKRQQAQAEHFNRSGLARTRDHEMITVRARPAAAGQHRYSQKFIHIPKPRDGPGQFKVWTGAAICQAAWAPPEQPGRTASKAEGASQAHTRECGMFTGDMIERGQHEHGLS